MAKKAETAAAPKKAAAKKPAVKKAVVKKAVVKKAAAKKPAAKKPVAAKTTPTAIVTGACGFAGGHMVDYLIEKGYKVIATDLEKAPREYLNPAATFIPADITNIKSLEPLFKTKVDKVFHPAAVFDYEAPWELCEKVNVGGMRNICDISLKNKVSSFVLFSTVSVYGHPEPDELPVREDNVKRPGTNYERSKLMQEEIGLEYVKKGLPVAVVRPAPVYGPRNTYGMATILFLLAKFPIMPFPINFDSYIVGVNVRDVCGAAYFVSTKKEAVGECYNVIDSSRYSIREFVEFVCPLMNVHIIPIFIPQDFLMKLADQAADVAKSVSKLMGTRPFVEKDMVYYLKAIYTFSNDKLRALGYEFEYPDMLDGIRETIEWYKDNGYLDRWDLWQKALFTKMDQ
ncbi:MAG: NAD(P)-dependent oxidoreductase [bacterium]